tara:strand:+ start:1687 stop:2406 length:720 start_codon:yes stop_codon:yes gene_type:complete
MLKHSEIEGYQPVSRIGEVVINSFVDAFEHTALESHVYAHEVDGTIPAPASGNRSDGTIYEYKPHFHEWVTALPGMICVSRKARNATFRGYTAAETATPVISCCACLKEDDMKNFYFAGVCRSKSVRPIDDGVGPQTDEFFTLAIGGMVTLLNNSGTAVFPGDYLEWTFYNSNNTKKAGAANAIGSAADLAIKGGPSRGNSNPRRIAVKIATSSSERIIGRCLSFAKSGETFDLLLKAC